MFVWWLYGVCVVLVWCVYGVCMLFGFYIVCVGCLVFVWWWSGVSVFVWCWYGVLWCLYRVCMFVWRWYGVCMFGVGMMFVWCLVFMFV